MRRFGRVQNIARLAAELPVRPYFFDLIYCDGEPLIDQTTAQRRARLETEIPSNLHVPRLATTDPIAAQAFFNRTLEAGHEGVMAKANDAPYVAACRANGWLKIKPTHTLDLVILAAEWGSGRRRGWLSNFHLGARDPNTGGFVMLGKTFKGMTDEVLAFQTQALQGIQTERRGHTVFVEPQMVVEIAFNDIQKSTHYPGGFALRFARLIRHRPDKSAAEADTINRVKSVYQAGFRTAGVTGSSGVD